MIYSKWELYDIRNVPTGKKRRFECFTHIGLFRKLEKNETTLQYEYIYKEKQIDAWDYQKYCSSKKRLEYCINQVKETEEKLKKSNSSMKTAVKTDRKMKQFFGLKYMTNYRPPKLGIRKQIKT